MLHDQLFLGKSTDPSGLTPGLLINNSAINPIMYTHENVKIALPYPPSAIASAPTKNTAAAVKALPVWKHNPVYDERKWAGNNSGIRIYDEVCVDEVAKYPLPSASKVFYVFLN